ncbi:MFS family permease [Sinorhizobium fredii]|uniref:MFS transporter n=3 Tax=Sinorhizobium TaxID=28105 RepID=A0A2A6LNP3_RHIFR|nr:MULTISPECIES: MFS transporter [Sinorhizobium]AFL55068.1 putative integral membrane transport protein [Sinorhizobium fredii USDA 257]MQX11481.1 MFS transporter [Sinorhizobium fredii]OAP44254.1 transporter [Sinorhizobium glycinis]PDT43988.1 MFS transporter [Sinorhizobium fredii]CCE98865.1 putative Membrane protein [Sinorhizobium fredii HH103]
MRRLLTPWRGVAAGFLLNGILLGTWASRVPAVMGHFHVAKASFGVLLLLLGLGALISFPITGRLSDSLGAVRVARMIAIPFLVSIAALGLAPTIPLLAIALFLFGMCHGSMDVAVNSWASEVEKHMGRPVMSSFHAMWSVGAVLGAAGGYIATVFQTPVYVHFLVTAVTIGGLLGPFLLLDWQSTIRTHESGAVGLVLPNSGLFLVGLIALASGLGEGTALDWSAVYLHDVVGTEESDAALGYMGFSAAMVMMRLKADSLVTRWGSATVARISGFSAVFGILLIVLGETLPLVVAGFVLMGVGYAAVLPLAFSRAAADLVVPAGKAIASVAIFAYGAMTLGPFAIGLLAEATTMRLCFFIVGLFAALVAVLAPVLKQ